MSLIVRTGCAVLSYLVTAPLRDRIEGNVRTILVVGGGYAGLYTAWKLEKKLQLAEISRP